MVKRLLSKSKYGHIKKDAEKILAMKAARYKKREIAKENGSVSNEKYGLLSEKRRRRKWVRTPFREITSTGKNEQLFRLD